jgi:hypothetical protein
VTRSSAPAQIGLYSIEVPGTFWQSSDARLNVYISSQLIALAPQSGPLD